MRQSVAKACQPCSRQRGEKQTDTAGDCGCPQGNPEYDRENDSQGKVQEHVTDVEDGRGREGRNIPGVQEQYCEKDSYEAQAHGFPVRLDTCFRYFIEPGAPFAITALY